MVDARFNDFEIAVILWRNGVAIGGEELLKVDVLHSRGLRESVHDARGAVAFRVAKNDGDGDDIWHETTTRSWAARQRHSAIHVDTLSAAFRFTPPSN